jgi:murein DD-endopeptidase MepM/ murein hydrolase activator NlpD
LPNATITARRLLSRLRGDATDPGPRAKPALRPGLGLARRADEALRSIARGPQSVARTRPPGNFFRHPALLLRRFEAPERLVPVLVAAFLLVASVTAVPGPAGGARGATEGVGAAPRIAVGGVSARYLTGPALDGRASEIVDPGLDVDETVGGIGAAQREAVDVPDVTGQFLADGTLLKPVVVDSTVEDGRDQLRRYRVRPGDTLTEIASRHGVSMMTLWWANDLDSKDDLKIGQELVIPPVSGLVVTVRAGDTLESVARANRVGADEIVEMNELTSRTLVIGQVLILPGARGEAYPTPKPTPRPRLAVATVSQPTTRGTTRPPARYTGGAFAWPVSGGFISQYFWYAHPALDIAADYGTPIRAAAAGRVIFAGWRSNGGGFQVWIAHGGGLHTTYSHMSSIAVGAGSSLDRGSFIGRVGTSGWSTGPHVHFEVWLGGVWGGGSRVNPLGYL